MIRFTPPVIEGNITSVNNLLEVNSGVLQFGGSAVKNTTGNLGAYNLVFINDEGYAFGLADFSGTGRYFAAGMGGVAMASGLVGGEDITGANARFRSGATGIVSAFAQSGFSGVQFDTFREQMEADCIVTDENTMSEMGLRVKYDVGSTLFMQGFTGEQVNFQDAGGTPWFTYDGDTSALTIGNTGTGVTMQGSTIGFFGNSVSAQSATTVAAAVTVADLVAALTTWQTALNNYGLITFV